MATPRYRRSHLCDRDAEVAARSRGCNQKKPGAALSGHGSRPVLLCDSEPEDESEIVAGVVRVALVVDLGELRAGRPDLAVGLVEDEAFAGAGRVPAERH